MTAKVYFHWDYEETDPPYYHIYSTRGPLEDTPGAIAIEVPLCSENTEDIKALIAALDRLSAREEARLAKGS